LLAKNGKAAAFGLDPAMAKRLRLAGVLRERGA
jgi:hypothetical protein